jgi:LPS export ABC transporter protein LptC
MPAALILGALLLLACDDRQATLSAIEDQKQVPTLTIDSLHINYTESGLRRMNLQAPLLQRYLLAEEPCDVFPEGMHIYFYTAANELENEIVADYAYHREKPEEYWKAVGNVVVKNHLKQQTLYTDTLFWDRVKRNIYTHAPVRIVTPDLFFDGLNGMIADERFEGYKFFNATNGMLYLNDEPAAQDSAAAVSPVLQPAQAVAPVEALQPSTRPERKRKLPVNKMPVKAMDAAVIKVEERQPAPAQP